MYGIRVTPLTSNELRRRFGLLWCLGFLGWLGIRRRAIWRLDFRPLELLFVRDGRLLWLSWPDGGWTIAGVRTAFRALFVIERGLARMLLDGGGNDALDFVLGSLV